MGNEAQREYWTGDVGARWARLAAEIDATFAEVTAAVIDRAGLAPGEAALDVGCGAGSLPRAAQARVVPGGRVTGLDISPTMLAAARLRSDGEIEFFEGDAEIMEFGGDRHDAVISQFGVMFFVDSVAAFANLRRAARRGGRLTVAVWGGAEHNPWFSVPRAIAVERLGPVDQEPDAPGPMRFRDLGTICDLLAVAGWRDVAGEAVDLALTPAGPLAEIGRFATRLGGAAAVIGHHGAGEAAREEIAARIAAAFSGWQGASGLRVPARINLVSALA